MSERKPIRVLHFCTEPVRGGAEEHMLLLLRHLDRRLFELHLVCPPEVLTLLGSDLPDDVNTIPLSFTSPIHINVALRFVRVLLNRQVDIVHSHMFRASLAASPIARLCRVPVTIETAHVREYWRQSGLKANYVVDRIAGRFVSRYIAVSNAISKYLIEEKKLSRDKIRVISNGCDVEHFRPEHPIPVDLRSNLGFDASNPVVVVSARLEPQKGHQVLLNALPEVIRQFPRLRVICIGDGQLRSQLEQYSDALGLNSCVRFLGYQSNVRDWLALADFTVLPSFFEGLPLTAIESLAAGRTIVATEVDGTPEVVVNRKTGLTVPPGNPERLAKAMIELLKDHHYRDKLACEGRRWVVENFSQSRQVRQTEELYLHALADTVLERKSAWVSKERRV